MDSFGSLEATAYPNPFASNATIEFENKGADANTTVEVFSLDGAKITELFNGPTVSNQLYQIDWNAAELPAGVYMYRIVTGSQVATGRIVHK